LHAEQLMKVLINRIQVFWVTTFRTSLIPQLVTILNSGAGQQDQIKTDNKAYNNPSVCELISFPWNFSWGENS